MASVVRPSAATEIIAHRGASYDAPENTVASLTLGFEQGADAGELDIHLTKDGKILVLHDYDTGRVTGVTNKITETSFGDLRKLEAGKWGKWKTREFSEKLPAFSEVLALVPDGKRLFIEIKCGPEVLLELQRELQAAAKKPGQIIIIGFDLETMRQTKQRLPELPVLFLAGADKKKQYPSIDDLIAKAKAARLDGLDLERGFPIDEHFVKKVHAAGLTLYTWTVDDPEAARRLAAAGVDGITTNRPGWLRQQL